jgi:hypothetical protein
VSALGHYLEAAGIATVSISLIRTHTEQMTPPRALWVPFELGRPLGAPNNAAFQTKVLSAALALLERTDSPLIEDFLEDAPSGAGSAEDDNWVCPVSFPVPAGEETMLSALKREIAGLQPWYALGLEWRGRTTFGISGLEMDAIGEFLAGFAENGLDQPNPLPELPIAEAFKRANDDLQAFFQEAATAQPGHGGTHADVLDWFWGQTHGGKVLLACRDAARETDDARLRFMVNGLMVPRLAAARLGI